MSSIAGHSTMICPSPISRSSDLSRVTRDERSLDCTDGRQSARLGLSMAKTRTRKPKLRTITIDQFDRDMLGALAAARKPGGVVVVDAHGNVRFRMTIPHTALPESRR